jgi:mono/diheme cytochrome c family protein
MKLSINIARYILIFSSFISSGMNLAFGAESPEVIRLNQGWTAQQRSDYYWGPQGSALISYDIYLALQLAGSNGLFNDSGHANKMGLLMDPPDLKNNPDSLPIGISKTVVSSGQYKGVYMGMTCAACHTGQVQYKGKQIRIDGGVANRFEINTWIRSLSDSLNATLSDPARFRVLFTTIQKSNPSIDEKELKGRLQKDADIVSTQVKQSFTIPFMPGPGRMDALGSIHNDLTGIQTGLLANIYPANAPVKPPFLWNAPQSAWVQWSGMAQNPLRRNFGESLGVFARYNLMASSPDKGLFEGTMDIRGQVKLEQLLKRLAPPQWPENILGKLDQNKVKNGQRLFVENCQGCHTSYPYRWSAERAPGKRFIENSLVPQEVVGTDDTQFKGIDFKSSPVILTGTLAPYFQGKEKVSNGEFSQIIQNKLLISAVEKAGPFSKEEFARINSYTNYLNEPPAKTAILSYKAAPRDGVWATGPFLHNGSVPNIYELLSPAAERTKSFYVTREFDPIKLGVNTSVGDASDYLLDTSLIGNSNAGHSFEDGFKQVKDKGIVGRKLLTTERYAIIEYLKSIPNQPGRATPFGGPEKPLIASEDKTWFNYKFPYNGLGWDNN